MADSAGTRDAQTKFFGMHVELWTGTIETGATDTCACKTGLGQVKGAVACWTKDIGTSASALECTVSGKAVNVTCTTALQDSETGTFALIVWGYP